MKQGLKLTTSRCPGDVINCHREDQYSLSGRPRDEENFVGTDFIFLFTFSILSANQNGSRMRSRSVEKTILSPKILYLLSAVTVLWCSTIDDVTLAEA